MSTSKSMKTTKSVPANLTAKGSSKHSLGTYAKHASAVHNEAESATFSSPKRASHSLSVAIRGKHRKSIITPSDAPPSPSLRAPDPSSSSSSSSSPDSPASALSSSDSSAEQKITTLTHELRQLMDEIDVWRLKVEHQAGENTLLMQNIIKKSTRARRSKQKGHTQFVLPSEFFSSPTSLSPPHSLTARPVQDPALPAAAHLQLLSLIHI